MLCGHHLVTVYHHWLQTSIFSNNKKKSSYTVVYVVFFFYVVFFSRFRPTEYDCMRLSLPLNIGLPIFGHTLIIFTKLFSLKNIIVLPKRTYITSKHFCKQFAFRTKIKNISDHVWKFENPLQPGFVTKPSLD